MKLKRGTFKSKSTPPLDWSEAATPAPTHSSLPCNTDTCSRHFHLLMDKQIRLDCSRGLAIIGGSFPSHALCVCSYSRSGLARPGPAAPRHCPARPHGTARPSPAPRHRPAGRPTAPPSLPSVPTLCTCWFFSRGFPSTHMFSWHHPVIVQYPEITCGKITSDLPSLD